MHSPYPEQRNSFVGGLRGLACVDFPSGGEPSAPFVLAASLLFAARPVVAAEIDLDVGGLRAGEGAVNGMADVDGTGSSAAAA